MFFSILYPDEASAAAPLAVEEPDYFSDLNLNQMVAKITTGRERYRLEPLFYTLPQSANVIAYRQNVLRDLENEALLNAVRSFSDEVVWISDSAKTTSEALAKPDGYEKNHLTRGKFLSTVKRYIRSIDEFTGLLQNCSIRSEGFLSFLAHLNALTQSNAYRQLKIRVDRLYRNIDTVKYCMLIKGGTIRVRKYEGQEDESVQLLALFTKFKQKDSIDYRHKLPDHPYAEHIEAAVLDMLAKWYPDLFADLVDFCKSHRSFIDKTVERLANEVQFYIGYLSYLDMIPKNKLRLCYPVVTHARGRVYALDTYDLVLARKIVGKQTLVPNDFMLAKPEKILVVTGPNQGGKTTYARTIGQIQHLGQLGLCVPGSSARLMLCDRIYTHFGREEDPSSGSGQLMADLKRLKPILEHATDASLIVINEIFSSTTAADASKLAMRMMHRIIQIGALAVCVTFLDELASIGPETVSMMSTVDPEDAYTRTFRIIRKPADGLAYALHIAGKHRLTYDKLIRRLQV